MEIGHSGKHVKFQIDTGATINAIPRYLIPNVKLQESNTKLKSWCSTELKVKGSCRLILKNPKNRRKYLVTNAPVLTYYDMSKDLEIQCDSSKSGIGSVLLQGGRPIAYASRAMTPTEVLYAQIEKEMLAIVFSLHKFHQYTFCR